VSAEAHSPTGMQSIAALRDAAEHRQDYDLYRRANQPVLGREECGPSFRVGEHLRWVLSQAGSREWELGSRSRNRDRYEAKP
jgi:hypothetical protein